MDLSLGPLSYAVITGIFAAGASVGAVKKTLNGSKEKIDDIHRRLANHIYEESHADAETHSRITKLETKMDLIIAGLLKLKHEE